MEHDSLVYSFHYVKYSINMQTAHFQNLDYTKVVVVFGTEIMQLVYMVAIQHMGKMEPRYHNRHVL